MSANFDKLKIDTPDEFSAAPFETLDRLNYLTSLGAAGVFNFIADEMERLSDDRRMSDESRAATHAAYLRLAKRLCASPMFERAARIGRNR